MHCHTPGPWKVIKPGYGHKTKLQCVQIGTDDTYTTLELQPEDARLIAAAPDLLAALKHCEECLSVAVRANVSESIMPDVGSHGAIKKARAAIAKATRPEFTE